MGQVHTLIKLFLIKCLFLLSRWSKLILLWGITAVSIGATLSSGEGGREGGRERRIEGERKIKEREGEHGRLPSLLVAIASIRTSCPWFECIVTLDLPFLSSHQLENTALL